LTFRGYKRQKLSDNSELSISKADSDKIGQILIKSQLFSYCDLYCICCTPTQENESYVGCEVCHTWFHYQCVGFDKNSQEEFICATCLELDQKSSRQEVAMSEEEFVTFFSEGKN
jgi:hypothetical protein